jgi:hypothetical protein
VLLIELEANGMTNPTPAPQDPNPAAESLAEEHARLHARMAELVAEYEALRQRPAARDEHVAYLAKLEVHIKALHEHIRHIRDAAP